MRLILLLFFVLTHDLIAQININGDIDVSNFPEISFTINNRDTNPLSKNSVKITQHIDSKKVIVDSIKIESLVDTNNYSLSNKCVLVLIESIQHSSRYEQYYTFRKSLLESFSDIVNKGDKIQLFAFSLRQRDTKILRKINSGFTDDISLLKKSLNKHVVDDNVFSREPVSDLYGAVLEAIEVLNNFETTLPKSILILSEERNNIYSTQKSSDNAIEKALRHNISINSIKYNRSNYLQHNDPTLADQTYGTHHVLKFSSGDSQSVNSEKAKESSLYIKSIFNNIVKLSKGKDYKISFISKDLLRDGKTRSASLNVNNLPDIDLLKYKQPGNWIYKNFQQYLIISIIVSICILILFFFLLKKLYDRYKKKIIDEKERIEQQEKINLEQEQKIKEQEKKFNELKQQEQDKLQKQKEDELEESRIKEEELKIKAMLALGKFPVIRYSYKNTSDSFEINRPNILIGRDKLCDIHIENAHLSRKHFYIKFIDNNYNLIDNNSANGIKLNGVKIEKNMLKNGDIIEIADMKFIFYI